MPSIHQRAWMGTFHRRDGGNVTFSQVRWMKTIGCSPQMIQQARLCAWDHWRSKHRITTFIVCLIIPRGWLPGT